MDLLLLLTYAAICVVIFKVFKIPLNKWSVPTAALGGIVLVGALVFLMNYNHPYSEVTRNYFITTPIVPSVSGQVTEVPIRANQKVKQGDVLFRIDPLPFANKVTSINAQLVSALNAQSVSTALIRGVVLVVVVLGIASVLVVSVVQKRREIGILRAMGATQAQILRVFLLQGALVGAAGSAPGVLLAVALIWAFTTFVKGSDGLPLFSITLAPALALRIALIATACGVLAAVAPARRAAALDPAQAIRL